MKCGCTDTALDISPNFSNCPTECPPGSEECSEMFAMKCIAYTGDDIVEFGISNGDRLDEVIQKLILGISNPGCVDYSDPLACTSALNLLVSNITNVSFEIEWDVTLNATGYSVEYKDATSLTWLILPTVVAPTNSQTIVNLQPDTIYDIRVNAICPAGTCYSLNLRIKTTL